MLFVCHSSLDREEIVKPILYHLYEFGIDIWYDHKKLFLSDSISFDIYKKGILESSDILIIYSRNLIENSKCGLAELDVIYKNCKNKTLYPVLYKSDLKDYSNQHLELLKSTIFYKVTLDNTYQVAVQIAIKLLKKIISRHTKNIGYYNKITNILKKNVSDIYLSIPPYNNREKIVFLLLNINNNYNKHNRLFQEFNIDTMLNYFSSLIKLNSQVTENDVRLLELLNILVILTL